MLPVGHGAERESECVSGGVSTQRSGSERHKPWTELCENEGSGYVMEVVRSDTGVETDRVDDT